MVLIGALYSLMIIIIIMIRLILREWESAGRECCTTPTALTGWESSTGNPAGPILTMISHRSWIRRPGPSLSVILALTEVILSRYLKEHQGISKVWSNHIAGYCHWRWKLVEFHQIPLFKQENICNLRSGLFWRGKHQYCGRRKHNWGSEKHHYWGRVRQRCRSREQGYRWQNIIGTGRK